MQLMKDGGLSNERLAFVRLRLVRGHMNVQIEGLREQDIDRPQLFDVAQEDVLVSLHLQRGNVVFLSGNEALSTYLSRPRDLGRLVDLRQTVREERFHRRIANQQRAVGTCDRSLVSCRDGWLDLCPPNSDGYHVIGMDEDRRRVFAFRSAPDNRVVKYQLCYTTISVADRPMTWRALSAPPDPDMWFVDAARFVRTVSKNDTTGVQSIVRLSSARGIDEHRLLTIEESVDGPLVRWSDPFSADYAVLGPDWRESVMNANAVNVPAALLLQERADRGYAVHRLRTRDCPNQQLYAYLVNAGQL